MEMTAAAAGPAGTNYTTRPAPSTRPPKWWEVALIVATSGALALPGYALWQVATTCGNGFECGFNSLFSGAFSVVVMPVASALVWRGCRIPRPFLLAVATVAIGHVLAVPVANGIGANTDGLARGTTLVPLVYVLVGVISGLAAIVLVWMGTWSWWVRVGVVPLIAVLSLAGHAFGERVARQQHQDRLSATGVTMYLPNISDRATPSFASAFVGGTEQRIIISYQSDSAEGADPEFPRLILLATTDGGCGDAARAGYFYMEGAAGPPDSTCRKTADGFVAADPQGTHYVGVTRGDTMLVFLFPGSSFDDAKVADSLRHAPQVSVADLARL